MRPSALATAVLVLGSLVLTSLVVAACGGGGSAPVQPPVTALIEMGTVASTVPTTRTVVVTNTTAGDLILDVASQAAPFTVAPGQLPRVLPSGSSTDLVVVFDPPSSGFFQGTIGTSLTPESGATSLLETVFTAQAERVSTVVNQTSISFGDVLPGDSATVALRVTNLSRFSPAVIQPPFFPSAAFSISSPSLPTTVAPGMTTTLLVRYAPTSPGLPVGIITLDTGDADGPTIITLGGSSGGQEIVDFGTVSFDGFGDTAELTFDVPADAISFMIEAETNAFTSVGLRLLTGPGGRVYENLATTGPYVWNLNPQYFNAQVPNTDRTEVQLVPGGGTYTLQLMLWSGSDNDVDVRVIIERRSSAAAAVLGTLDLNVFLADAITPTAASAAGDTRLQAILLRISTILQQRGISLGDIDYYDINDPRYDDVTEAEFGPLLATTSKASQVRLNLFFVRKALSGGVLGAAATLGGPSRNGTELSGVMSLFSDSYSTAFLGLVAAHEICHFIGLSHTVEQNGQHDDVLDTAECPSNGTNAACTTTGGGYLMHWQAVGGLDITDGQGWIIRGHPLLSPALIPADGSSQKIAPPPSPIVVPAGISSNWCGTCRHEHADKPK